MGSQKLIEIAKQGRTALLRWRHANPDMLLNLSEADLSGVDLRGANLKRADLTGANLTKTNLSGALLAEADLTRAKLTGARLSKTDFRKARLFAASLIEAHCAGADFTEADFTHADLSDADLSHANLTKANLTEAVLARVNLIAALFHRTELRGADFSLSRFGRTLLNDLDLSDTRGLETLHHAGPSSLAFDTARRTGGQLPAVFLRGCGVPDNAVKAWDGLFGQKAKNAPCIVRYAEEDESFAVTFHERLQQLGIACWLDPMPAKAELKEASTAPSTFETDERVLLCCSKPALTSWWIEEEFERAAAREKQIREHTGQDVTLLYPLNLDGFMLSGNWKHRREKQIVRLMIDFTGWRRNSDKLDQEVRVLAQQLTQRS